MRYRERGPGPGPGLGPGPGSGPGPPEENSCDCLYWRTEQMWKWQIQKVCGSKGALTYYGRMGTRTKLAPKINFDETKQNILASMILLIPEEKPELTIILAILLSGRSTIAGNVSMQYFSHFEVTWAVVDHFTLFLYNCCLSRCKKSLGHFEVFWAVSMNPELQKKYLRC